MSLFLLALPLFGQYSGKNVSPVGSASAVLSGTSSGKSTGGNGHAFVYDSTLDQTVDLNPLGYVNSIAKGTDGVEQVGYSRSAYYGQCTIWKGTAASAVILTPPTYLASWCLGTDGGYEIGYTFKAFYIYSIEHATLWSGSANSYVDLHAGASTYSRGRAIKGNEQVGEIDAYADMDPDAGNISAYSKAVLWHGTAASMVILHPAGFYSSRVLATNGTQEGGWAYGTSGIHAMLWSGSAASFIDLHPAGYFDTRVTAMSATMQVGDGWVGGNTHAPGAHRHALAWTGSASSVIDLTAYAPIGYTDAVATGIDAAGNVVGYAFKTPTSGDHMPVDAVAVVFVATPAPPSPIASLTISPAAANSGDVLSGLVTLAAPAPAGGTFVNFFTSNSAVIPAPADLQIPEGATTASVVIPTSSATLSAVASVTLYSATGSSRKMATVTVSPVVQLTSLSVTPVQGGNQTSGIVNLNFPSSVPLTVTLSNGNPALTMPSSITFAAGQTSQSFVVTSTIVSTATSGTVSASYNGIVVSTTATVSPSVPVVISSVTIPSAYSGQTFTGTILLNHPAYLGGVTIALTTSNSTLAPVPATVNIPYGSSSATFTGTAGIVTAPATISITASLNGASVTGSLAIGNGPGATIQSLDYWSISHLIKVTATTTMPSGTLTFGFSANGPAVGVLTLEATTGLYQGSLSVSAAPATVWVWNSAGGLPVSSSAVRTRSR